MNIINFAVKYLLSFSFFFPGEMVTKTDSEKKVQLLQPLSGIIRYRLHMVSPSVVNGYLTRNVIMSCSPRMCDGKSNWKVWITLFQGGICHLYVTETTLFLRAIFKEGGKPETRRKVT